MTVLYVCIVLSWLLLLCALPLICFSLLLSFCPDSNLSYIPCLTSHKQEDESSQESGPRLQGQSHNTFADRSLSQDRSLSSRSWNHRESEDKESQKPKKSSSDYWKKASGRTPGLSKSQDSFDNEADSLLALEEDDDQKIRDSAERSAKTERNYKKASTSAIYSHSQEDEGPSSVLKHYAHDSSDDR